MRTSRLSKETASLLGKMAGPSSSASTSPPPPTRRTTRSSLARFAYTADASAPASATPSSAAVRDVVLGNDIEDAVTTTSRKRRKVAVKTEIKEEEGVGRIGVPHATAAETKPPPAARRARKPARVIKGGAEADAKVEPPSDWEEMYDVVKEMRLNGAARNAAVDTMGCERLFHPDAGERDRRFHILIALMLSSQTKDTVNAVAMKRLMTELPPCEEGKPGGLNLENILAVEPALLNELIWAVGFHNNKTKYIKAAAEILRDKFDGDVPDTIEGLTSLPGVGPKMGYLCLSAAWDRTEGIGVDVHVHRITNLWGWHKTTQPEATRAALQAWLPKDRWREINWLLVGLGQTVCLPVGRRCGDCELGLRGLCKAAERKKVVEGRKRREVKVEEDGDVVVKTEVIEEEEVLRDEVVNEVATESAPKAEVKDAESGECKPEEAADAPRKRRSRKG